MSSMPERRWRTALAIAVLVATACATGMDSAQRKPEPASGARIQIGQGHFNRDGKAFHYWDKEKEIPAVCARCHAATGVAQYLKEGKTPPRAARQERLRLHELPRGHAHL